MRITCTHTYLLHNFKCDLIEQGFGKKQQTKGATTSYSKLENYAHFATYYSTLKKTCTQREYIYLF